MDAPRTLVVAPDGRFPNAAFPALLYRSAFPADADAIEQAFADQGLSNAWRNGVSTYHHFHGTAHDVLGVAAGEVQVMLGGPSGQTTLLRAGDALVVPAGVGHCTMGQSCSLLVIGAYPNGDDDDIRLGNPADLQAAKRAIEAARFPAPLDTGLLVQSSHSFQLACVSPPPQRAACASANQLLTRKAITSA